MSGPMKVLGIDPGSRSTGWGIVTREQGRYRLLAAGAIRPDPALPMPVRLREIHEGLCAVLTLHAPTAVAIEAIFAHKSSTSALVLGQARGVAMLAAAGAGLEVFEYNASTIKSSVAGSGRADKEAVGKMVAVLLGGRIDGPHDAADAVAIAMTHHAHAHRHAAAARVAELTAKVEAARKSQAPKAPKAPRARKPAATTTAATPPGAASHAHALAKVLGGKAPTMPVKVLSSGDAPFAGPRRAPGAPNPTRTTTSARSGGGVAGGPPPPQEDEE